MRQLQAFLILSPLLACPVPLPDLVESPARCGDGRLSSGEACDDGNNYQLDGCTNDCEVARCGDGFQRLGLQDDSEGYEACDDGNIDDRDACTNSCTEAICGDGLLRRDLDEGSEGYEICDDGNDNDLDACTRYCAPHRCGDGIRRTDLAVGHEDYEACDDGNEVEGDDCRSNCVLASCGDGIVQENEACDDGNDIAGDACTASCTEARCGDGVLWNLEGGLEECDDGNALEADGCSPACLREDCGNARQDAGEACDDGNEDDFDGCRNHCALAVCGDGILRLDLEAGVDGFEACDDGNDSEVDSCLSDCSFASCGDGFLLEAVDEAPGEACDDGNLIDGDACTASCTVARCGDGVQRTDLDEGAEGYEFCDDGNDDPMDGCSNQCRADDHGDDQASASTVSAGELTTGAIHGAEDRDYFRWSSPIPGMYRFNVRSVNPDNPWGEDPEAEAPVDLRAQLQAAGGQVLDQWLVAPSASLEVTLRANEPVYLVLMPHEGGQDGDYRIVIQTTCGNGVVEDHESCDPADPLIGTFTCRYDCEWRRSLVNGWDNTCYRQEGVPWCTGNGGWLILGLPREGVEYNCGVNRNKLCSRQPIRTPAFDDGIKSISVGRAIVCFTNIHNEPLCFGSNSHGSGIHGGQNVQDCLWDRNFRCVDVPRPVQPAALPEVDGIAVVNRTLFALRVGVIWSWGDRSYGLNGNNTPIAELTTVQNTPRGIEMPNPGDPVLYMEGTANRFTICALTQSRSLYCWGRNGSGQTGIEPQDGEALCPAAWGRDPDNCVRQPVAPVDLGPVLDFAVGGTHTCALLLTGELYCWGGNAVGQLGIGDVDACNPRANWQCAASPQRVDLPDVIDIAAGSYHSCAALGSGRVACWGAGGNHQLGLGRLDNEAFPRLLGRINDAREISAGVYNSCVRHEDQRVSCWGVNALGETGTGMTSLTVPFPREVIFNWTYGR